MAEKQKGGRRELILNWDEIDNLLISGCKGSEIAAYFGCCDETIYERCAKEKGMLFSDYSAKMRSKGDSLLRVAQFSKALGKNPKADNTMLVWLGKNRLDQRDTPEKVVITEEAAKQFNALMDQFSLVQKKEEPADKPSE